MTSCQHTSQLFLPLSLLFLGLALSSAWPHIYKTDERQTALVTYSTLAAPLRSINARATRL